jgi:hypothetical protein
VTSALLPAVWAGSKSEIDAANVPCPEAAQPIKTLVISNDLIRAFPNSLANPLATSPHIGRFPWVDLLSFAPGGIPAGRPENR